MYGRNWVYVVIGRKKGKEGDLVEKRRKKEEKWEESDLVIVDWLKIKL